MTNMLQPIDREWADYPTGTKAYSLCGGYWTKVSSGWQWQSGSTFPTPGADAYRVILPEAQP